ncbi:MAG: hypothetical protein ACOCUU_00245 [Nanoarchaeota archaeon]
METCYKVFDKELKSLVLKTKSKGFDIEPEITAKILRKKYKIKEIPISYFPRKASQGKKIRFYDGFKAVITLLRFRFKSLD